MPRRDGIARAEEDEQEEAGRSLRDVRERGAPVGKEGDGHRGCALEAGGGGGAPTGWCPRKGLRSIFCLGDFSSSCVFSQFELWDRGGRGRGVTPSDLIDRPYTAGGGGVSPPLRPPPPPPLPMFEADGQSFVPVPSVPRGFTLQNCWPAFSGDHRGTLGGGGGSQPNPPPPPFRPPSPPFQYSPGYPPPPSCPQHCQHRNAFV